MVVVSAGGVDDDIVFQAGGFYLVAEDVFTSW